ncbi:MAG: IgGFc-binding protein, partial [Deltaproteobacteria bacterium]|nr:IgGFc-binding protein [Deltaproteobacteria bacterium]
GDVCAPGLAACTACVPGARRCDGRAVELCDADGAGFAVENPCDDDPRRACRAGRCADLCGDAAEQRSNVGCEYWPADLDNASLGGSLDAAAQQFAVVVSNPQPDLAATVTVEQDDGAPGDPPAPVEVARIRVPPLGLEVLRLGPREVDGSPPGEFNTGTHTALTRAAYRLRSTVPVVVAQFNPLENSNVFSNDASLLKPLEALPATATVEPSYVVLGWPQTIASTEDPETNFSAEDPTDLRAFLTLVGTSAGTTVVVRPRTRVLGGGAIAETPAGGVLELRLDAFDVANLETDDFNADFTGTVIESDRPLVVYSGSEASDAPWFRRIADRQCCADHLEEQLDPIRTAGRSFVATVSADRSSALARAGATGVTPIAAPEYFRVVAATKAGARIRTTRPAPDDRFELSGLGDHRELTATADFFLESDAPVHLGSVSASQAAAGIARGLPGGDPSLLVVPPIEQFRSTYVFLTPDRYAFDFVRVVAPRGAELRLDGAELRGRPGCESRDLVDLDDAPGAPTTYEVHRCQLSFPIVDTSTAAESLVSPGDQDDGVHELLASANVGVIVEGFDRNVSYAYAGGTELRELTLR